jgi:hypothetical protein
MKRLILSLAVLFTPVLAPSLLPVMGTAVHAQPVKQLPDFADLAERAGPAAVFPAGSASSAADAPRAWSARR